MSISMLEAPSTSSPPFRDYSPRSSPARKRQRLSSPTYDEHLGDLSQEDIAAFDIIEAQYSQSQSSIGFRSQSKTLYTNVQYDRTNNSLNNLTKPTDDSDDPFAVCTKNLPASFTTASSASLFGFSKASDVRAEATESFERSPSPEEPSERDFDSWFQPAATLPSPAFQNASAVFSTVPTTGFTKASHKGLIVPSSSALAKAQAKMQDIWQEPDPTPISTFVEPFLPARAADVEDASPVSGIKSPLRRPALQSVENSLSFNSPITPSPLDASHLTTLPRKQLPAKSFPAMTPTQLFISKNSKPFKSPLINKQAITRIIPSGSILNPGSQSIPSPNYTSTATFRRPNTPRIGPVKGKSQAPFVTPFKPGADIRRTNDQKAEEPQQTQVSYRLNTQQLAQAKPHAKEDQPARTCFFNLTLPLDRQTMQSFGLKPQRLKADKLAAMEIPPELLQMTPQLAIYYSFHIPTDDPSSHPPAILGPEKALRTLINNGCLLATKSWVDNHWSLILWKLAGMACLNPHLESKVEERKWCGEEVMRQLYYRYERELNQGKRPPLRLITTQDASAAYPMVLCISDIVWTESESMGNPGSHPELEVTDGWYRIRAQVDAPLARAIRRGLVRVGRKIMVAGAYLFSERKEPSEVLEAYNSVKLVISGNSSHMAPWHAKLGFVPGPCTSTLHSLTPDGGTIAVMDLVIIKIHSIAYFEFTKDENENKIRSGPMNAVEEAAAQYEWKKRWEHEMSKLRSDLDDKWNRYMGYMERLERHAGGELESSQDDLLGNDIESVYDELEDPAQAPKVIGALAKSKCVQLARYMRERMEKDKLRMAEDLEKEMRRLCPPREVRNFRVIVVQDARIRRRPRNRKALLTVWDVLSLSFYEGGTPGSFEIGQRFMVTNLMPTQQNCWMGLEPSAEVYLCTGQHSRWTPIRTSVGD